MAFGSRFAGEVDVEFRAETGRFRADVNEARQVYERTTGAMSDAALKQVVAQEKLDRAIKRFGAESHQARQATIAYRNEMRSLQAQVDRTGREVDQTRRSLDRMGRGALAGSGIFQGFARSIAFASSAFLGGAGLIFAIRSSINAAKEEELVLGQTRVALEALGISYDEHRKRIDEVVRAQSRLGFDDEALLKTFQLFVRATGDVNQALERNALTLDVARGRYIDLESASQIVLKAQLGMGGALRRAGIDAEKGASSVELLRLLTEKYAGAAEAAANTSIGATDRLAVAWENAKEVVGAGLLPTVNALSNEVEAYVSDAENMRELQRTVNTLVRDGGQVVRGFAGAVRSLNTLLRPLVDLLGGTEDAVEGLILALATAKIIAFGRAIRGVGVSAQFARKELGLLAATSFVPGFGGAVPTARGGPSGLPVPRGGALLALLALVFGPDVLQELQEQQQKGEKGIGRFFPDFDIIPGTSFRDLLGGNAPETPTPPVRRGRRPDDRAGPHGPGGVAAERAERERRERNRRNQRDRFTFGDVVRGRARLEERLVDAEATDSTRDDVRILSEELALIERGLRELELKRDQRLELKQRRNAILRQLESIRDEEEREAAEIRQKAAARRRARAEAAAKALEEHNRLAEEHERRIVRSGAPRPGGRSGGTGEGFVPRGRRGRRGGEEEPVTERQIREMLFEFITGLQGISNQFGSNLFPPGAFDGIGQTATHAHAQTELLREQNRSLEKLTRGMWFPGAGYASTELSAAGLGAGF